MDMKVLQTIQGLASLSGGPSTCTKDLMDCLNSIDQDIKLFTLRCCNPNDSNLGQGSDWLIEWDCDYFSPLYISRNTRRFLKSSDYDLYHTNGLWMYTNHITCRTARKKGKPYILSPHGMLYSNALKIKPYRKKLMLKLWFNEDVHRADCLHATCLQEMQHIRKYGYKGPIAVIPNPVIIPEGVALKGVDYESQNNGKIQLGILARLNPIKKIENLIMAAAKVIKGDYRDDIEIVIMGKGNDDYEKYLRELSESLEIADNVKFLGFVNGKRKYDQLSRLRALFVPSESENFGMIVPEALICGTPVYASLGTPWEELNTHNCGWWRENSDESIANVIREVINLSIDKLLEMGHNGRKLIEKSYGQDMVAHKMLNLYEWILSNKTTSKPLFIYE